MLPQVGADCKMGDEGAVSRRGYHDEPVNVSGIEERIFDAGPRDQTAHRVTNKNDSSMRILFPENSQFAGKEFGGTMDEIIVGVGECAARKAGCPDRSHKQRVLLRR